MAAVAFLLLVIIILLVIFIARTSALSSKVGELELRVRALEPGPPVHQPAPAEQTAAVLPDHGRIPVIEKTAPGVPAPAPPPPESATLRIPPPPSRTKEEWEALIGGKLLNRIGALALIIGVGFFLKYAFDNNWITESSRVLIGASIGLASLLGAARTHKKGFQIFAQGLVGAGVAILYLSVYASFNFYQLLSQPVAFVLMAAVTAIAFAQAFRYDSIAVSLLAWFGGFLTPFLLSTGESNELGLFVYVLLLDIGVILILTKKDAWMALEPLSMIGTYVLYFAWFNEHYTESNFVLTLVFLAVFWGLFHSLDVLRATRTPESLPELRRLVAGVNALLFYVGLVTLIDPHHHAQLGLATALASLPYLASAVTVGRTRPESKAAIIQYSLSGATLLAVAVAIEYERFLIVLLWSVEAVALVWIGVRLDRRYMWGTGLLLLWVTALTLLGLPSSLSFSPIAEFRLLFNERAGTFLLVTVSFAAAAILLNRVQAGALPVLRTALHYSWIVAVFLLLSVETNDLFRSWMINASEIRADALGFSRFMTLSAVWAACSLPLVWAGAQKNFIPPLFSGVWAVMIAACLASIRGIAFDPVREFTPVLNLRLAAVGVVAIAVFLQMRWLKECLSVSSWLPDIRSVLRAVAVVLLLVAVTGEVRDTFQKAVAEGGAENRIRLENLEQISLSGAWLLFSIALMGIGIWRHMRNLRVMAIVIFGFTILKIFIYDLSFLETLYRIFSFIALGVILLAVSYLYQRYRAIIFEPSVE